MESKDEAKAVEYLQYANFPHFSCMDKNIFISLPQESYIKKRLTMNTLTYDNQTQLIVTIDDTSLVKKISEAVRLIWVWCRKMLGRKRVITT